MGAVFLSREALEDRERDSLAPYAARSGRTRGRVHAEPEHPYRTAFQRDRDRIIRSTAFRRLMYKTQVFVNYEGDHYRTRLTHTIEVAQIARTAARALNLNEDLTEAVALAHDVGHTPFGHSGEEALRALMAEHGGFEHNAHGLRVVDLLEHPYEGFPGLNLSYEVREGMAKHRTHHDQPCVEGFEPGRPPSLEAQVVEAADAMAYDSHDLDDGLAAEMITGEDLVDLTLWQRALARAAERTPVGAPLGRAGRSAADLSPRRVVKVLIDIEVTDLLETTQARLARADLRSPDDVRGRDQRLVGFSDELAGGKAELEAFLMERIYRHYRVSRMMAKARRFIEELFRAYIDNPRQLPPPHQARIAEEGPYRTVCDYVAGMTDRFAQNEYRKLFSPFEVV
jgi:dGTPase